MRPVNLIPPEERRGEAAPTRSGPLAYVVIGLLVLTLAGVTGIVTFNKKVSDRGAEAAALESQAAEAQAKAESLTSFTSFQQIHDARVATVDGLARSRFDWERVLQELSRIIPEHIWLTELAGTVAPGVDGSADGTGLRDGVTGPALELTGCGRTHSDVARLVAAMQDIDGVTRVTASDSAKPSTDSASGGEGSCQTRPNIPQFHLIAAFDEVVTGASAPGTTPDPATATTSTTSSTSTTPTTAADPAAAPADGTPSDAQQQKIDTATGIAGAG